MSCLLMLVAFVAIAPDATKPLPAVPEPDWEAWHQVDLEAKKRALEVWKVLQAYRPEREYKSKDKENAARKRVDEAYKQLDADPAAACASAVEILRTTGDSWERIMAALTINSHDEPRGRAFLIWAMAHSDAMDDMFEGIWGFAVQLAEERKPEHLPALIWILRTREGNVYLRLHSWFIPTHDCLFYVFGQYGRDAIPFLRPLLAHEDPYVRRNTAIVLGFFMDKASKPALLKMLDANDVGSGGAAFALGELAAGEAVKPIARLLENADARTRFWAAYALYELGSKDVLPELKQALAKEQDKDTRSEIQGAIEHLTTEEPRDELDETDGDPVRSLDQGQLKKAIQTALDANGLRGDFRAIARAAGAEQLEDIEAVRRAAMKVPSDLGHKWFRRWTAVIRAIRRRVE